MKRFKNKKISKYSEIEILIFIIGMFLSLLIRIFIKIIPLRYYFGMIKYTPQIALNDDIKVYFKKLVIKTIKRINHYSGWKCSCLNQVLTLKIICNIVGLKSEVFFVLFNNIKTAHTYLVIEDDISYLKIHNVKAITIKAN